MKAKADSLCPCHSGKLYGVCCMPLHLGDPPPNALALMRSRYSGYALGLIDYIVETTHPEHKEANKPLSIRKKEIEQFCKSTQFKGLDILIVEDGEDLSYVTFRAHLEQNKKPFSFTERSSFQKVKGHFCYLSGEVYNS